MERKTEPTATASSTAGSASATIASVERAADVLLHFVRTPGPDLGVTEIASALGLSKPAVHRMLASLKGRGFIQVDERTRRYSLGLSAMQLGQAYMDRIDVRRLAHPELVALSRRTNETATLSIRTGRTRIYVDQVTPDREVIMSIVLGEPYPLHAGGSSKAFLAFLPQDEIDEYLESDPLESLTANTVRDTDDLRRELADIRQRGWARSNAERKPGAASVAAPILDTSHRPIAVVSVSGPAERFLAEFDECRDALLESTRRLSAQFGHPI